MEPWEADTPEGGFALDRVNDAFQPWSIPVTIWPNQKPLGECTLCHFSTAAHDVVNSPYFVAPESR